MALRLIGVLKRPSLRHLYVFAAYLPLVGIAFWPVLTGTKNLLSHDNYLFHFPAFVANSIWSNDLGGGFPLFADPQNQIFYPLPYLFPRTPRGFDFYVMLSVVLASFFAYLLAFDLTRHRSGAFVAGLVFGLSGSVAGQISMANVTGTSAYLPLMALFYLRLLNTPFQPATFAGAVGATLIALLSGHMQVFLMLLLFCGLMVPFFAYRQGRIQWMKIASCGGAVTAAILLGAFAIIPLAELLPNTARSGRIGLESFTSYQMDWHQLVRLFFPFFFGPPGEDPLFAFSYPYPSSPFHNFHELHRYMGLLPGLLVYPAWLAIQDRRLRLFVTASFIFYFLFSLGSQTPFINAFYSLPVLNRLRGPARHFLEISLLASMVTAFGWKSISDGMPVRRMAAPLFSTVVLVACIPAAMILWHPDTRRLYEHVSLAGFRGNNLLAAGLAMLFVLALLIAARNLSHGPTARVLSLLLGSAAFLDLAAAARFGDWFFNAAPSETLSRDPEFPYDRLLPGYQALFTTPGAFDSRYYYRATLEMPTLLTSNISVLSGHSNAVYYNPLGLASRARATALMALRDDIADIYGVRYTGGTYRTPFLSASGGRLVGHCAALEAATAGISAQQNVLRFKLPRPVSKRIRVFSNVLCGEPFGQLHGEAITTNDTRIRFSIMGGTDTDRASGPGSGDSSRASFLSHCSGLNCLHVYEKKIDLPEGVTVDEIHLHQPDNMLVQILGISPGDISIPEYWNVRHLEARTAVRPFFRNHRFVSYDSERAFPQAYIVSTARPAREDEATLLLLNGSVDLRRTALVETRGSQGQTYEMHASPQPPEAAVSVTMAEQGRFLLKASTDRAAFLVFNQSYYPGWTATIDGQPTTVLKTNLAVMGLALSAGSHTVEFRFVPRSLYVGLAVSGATLLLLLLLLARWRRNHSLVRGQ